MLERRTDEQNDGLCDIMRRIDRAYDAYARSKGITYVGLLVLDYICSHRDHCTQRMICDDLYYSKQSVNQVVGSFLDAGYVVLREMPDDRRNKTIALTEEGERFAEDALGQMWRIDDDFMRLNPDRMEQLREILTMYADEFERGTRESEGPVTDRSHTAFRSKVPCIVARTPYIP